MDEADDLIAETAIGQGSALTVLLGHCDVIESLLPVLHVEVRIGDAAQTVNPSWQ